MVDVRPCPSCGNPPTKVYTYEAGRRGYCQPCRRVYSMGNGKPRKPAAPRIPRTRYGPTIPGYARGPEHATMCGYKVAHHRVAYIYGSASSHLCNQCGEPADQWALDPEADPAWLVRGPIPGKNPDYLFTWSLDIRAYRPLCRPCHDDETDRTRWLQGGARANARRHAEKKPRPRIRSERRDMLARGQCRHGHPIRDASDIIIRPRRDDPSKTSQVCRECKRLSQRRWSPGREFL